MKDVEAHYQQSVFIKELCMLAVPVAGEPAHRLHAIVVPDLDVLRKRRIVNLIELIRFELEGLSISLPPQQQVPSFDISMEPLPRRSTGELQRDEILKQYLARATHGRGATLQSQIADTEPHVARVVDAISEHLGPGTTVVPDSNLELDLGVDSVGRVELIAKLERRFGVRVPNEIALTAFAVRDLAKAFSSAEQSRAASEGVLWDSLLTDGQPAPEAEDLLRRQSLSALVLFLGLRVVGWIVHVRGEGLEHLPEKGAFIISPNHQSYIDPLFLASVLPFRVYRQLFSLGFAEYFETPIMRWLACQLNVVPVDPDANLLSAMRAAAFGLRQGRVLLLFPEGERSIDGRVKRFKRGAAILSRHVNVPIVPVAITGAFEIWPRNRRFEWRRLLPWSRHHVAIRFGEAITASAGESYEQDIQRVRDRVDRLWHSVPTQ